MGLVATRYYLHREDCFLARKAKNPRPIEDVTTVLRPCARCHPDLPARPRVVHRLCSECNFRVPYPCPHNGGIPVWTTAVRKRQYLVSDGSFRRVSWVWPENAHLYEKVRKSS